MLTPQQESTLTSGGDSFDHYHSQDRTVTQRTAHDLQSVLREREVAGIYAVTDSDDVLLCTAPATISLPKSKNGRELEVVAAATDSVLCLCSGSDRVYGESSVLLTVLGMALHFKAISGGWILI